MKLSKLTFAVATALTASVTTSAFALDLYVDSKTKQIYAEPGVGRQRLGSFEQVQEGIPVKSGGEVSELRSKIELQDNQIKALEEHAKAGEEEGLVEIKKDGGIEFKSRDGNFKMAINGRMQVDSQVNVSNQVGAAAGANTPNTLDDGVALRRGRLGIEGTFFKNTGYKFEYDFTRGNGTNGAGVTDAFLSYHVSKPLELKFGAFKEPFSLEEATSNRYLTFIERNMVTNTFIDNLNTYKMGIGASYSADRWQTALSLQTEPVGANVSSSTNSNGGANRNNGGGDTSWEVNGRVSGMPWMESKTKFWHTGVSGSYIALNNNYLANGSFSNGGVSFANGLNNNVDRTSILNTGNLTSGARGTAGYRQAEHLTRFGAETAVVYGPFSAQSEYIQTNVSGSGYGNGATLDGYYGYMSYFLTGESRAYKSKTGAWDRLKPNHNFDGKGGWGAWEVAAGYDYINLNDGAIKGGQASTAKLGVNWYVNPHVRVMADYVHALDINTVGASGARSQAFNGADLDIIETRFQLDW
ncbi:MAG: porin [Methylococcales bacterium]|nr:porin [Methylococcales bacterium]MDD5214236.1 porin [Methylococcales bacterium]